MLVVQSYLLPPSIGLAEGNGGHQTASSFEALPRI